MRKYSAWNAPDCDYTALVEELGGLDFTVEMSMCMHSPHIPGRGSRGNQTLLLCCHPDKEGDDLEGTHLHLDWAGAENVLLLFEDGDIKKPVRFLEKTLTKQVLIFLGGKLFDKTLTKQVVTVCLKKRC